mgnify:CR=1 FL=1
MQILKLTTAVMQGRLKEKNMGMKLYCFGESGHSYKAALALELAGCNWTPVFVDFLAVKPVAILIAQISTSWGRPRFW